MTQIALILGASGRFGGAMADALWQAGWTLRLFDRATDDLQEAARDVDIIVNGWNPPYTRWAAELPKQTQAVIDAARLNDARVVFPGNVYVYGKDAPLEFGLDTPHTATNPLGKLRRDAEAAYRKSGVAFLILRAGDYIDTEASGNWFDRVIAKPLGNGHIVYPGDTDVPHAWAFLPDLARAGAELLAQDLPHQIEVPYPGYTLTGRDMACHLSEASGRPITVRQMSWMPLRLGAWVSPFLAKLVEMRYLWDKPHHIDPKTFDEVLPRFVETHPTQALARTVAVTSLGNARQPIPDRDATPAPRASQARAT